MLKLNIKENMDAEKTRQVLDDLQETIHQAAKDKGFWPEFEGVDAEDDDEMMDVQQNINVGEKLALIHSETSEAFDAVDAVDIQILNLQLELDEIRGTIKPMATKAELAAIHSKISRALEAARKPAFEQDKHCPAFTNFSIELADTVIRIFDLAGGTGVELGGAILAKMKANAKRGYKHGKQF